MCNHRTYSILSAGAYATFGLILIVLSLQFEEFSTNKLGYLKQIAEDWERQPFVRLMVMRNVHTCPEGTEEVFFKHWYGSKQMCACYRGMGLGYYLSNGECTVTD